MAEIAISVRRECAMRTYTILLVVLIVVAVGAVAFQVFKSRSRVVERQDVNIQEIQQKMRGRRAIDQPGLGTLGK
jgi:cell division protein FtsL